MPETMFCLTQGAATQGAAAPSALPGSYAYALYCRSVEGLINGRNSRSQNPETSKQQQTHSSHT